jgi:hypothetical protein
MQETLKLKFAPAAEGVKNDWKQRLPSNHRRRYAFAAKNKDGCVVMNE